MTPVGGEKRVYRSPLIIHIGLGAKQRAKSPAVTSAVVDGRRGGQPLTRASAARTMAARRTVRGHPPVEPAVQTIAVRRPVPAFSTLRPLPFVIVAAVALGCAARRAPAPVAAVPPDVAVADAAVVDAGPPDAAPPAPLSVPPDARALPIPQPAVEGWRARLGDRLRAAGAVGWASAVIAGEAVVDRAVFGRTAGPAPTPITAETSRPLGTLSRVVTGLLIAALIEEGHLDWAAPVTRLRRDWPAQGVRPTVAEMACGCFGTAAVPGTPPQTAQQVLDRLKGHLAAGDTLEAMPTPVLAAAAGYLAGLGAPSAPIEPAAAYAQQVAERIAGPLGIGLTVGPPAAPGIVSVFAPDRGAWASLSDLEILAIALSNGGLTPSGGRVVERTAIDAGLAIIDGQDGPATRFGLRVEARGAARIRAGGGVVGDGITRLFLIDGMAWVVRVEGRPAEVEPVLTDALDDLLRLRYRLRPPAPTTEAPTPTTETPAAPPPATPAAPPPATPPAPSP